MKILKIAAVVFSIALFGLYVAYRSYGGGGAGERERLFYGSKVGRVGVGATTTASTTAPATAPAVIVLTTQPVPEEFLISSSKSGAVFKPQTFGGSKFAPVFRPADAAPVAPAAPQPFPKAEPLTLEPVVRTSTTTTTAPATTRTTLRYTSPATTQSSVIGAGFKLANTIGAEFAVAADMCSPPSTQPAGGR